MKKLWQKLTVNENKPSEIELHTAGATVRDDNPFERLKVPKNSEGLSKEFIQKWVVPFYMINFSNLQPSEKNKFVEIFHEITPDIIEKLLGDFNWRTRIVGAYFTALHNSTEFEEVIGNLLLKSEVCYAGNGYSLALATFGTEKSKDYLKRYLTPVLDKN